MNLILARPEELVDHLVEFTDHRADHIIKILQCEVGDIVRFGIVNGMQGTARVEALHRKHPRSVTLSVNELDVSRPIARIDLVLALARPIMMRRILSQATALGVGRFFFTHANRVEKSFWEASLIEENRYQEHLVAGLEQAMDTRLPEVRFFRRFKPFVEDFLPTVAGNYSHRLLAHPAGTTTLAEGMSGGNMTGRIILAVGPEGGWVDYEVQKLTEAGFTPCTLGERILKVDTAVIALHSRISQILEMSDGR